MPIHLEYDEEKNKWYYQWGNQKKYYFNTVLGEQRAYKKTLNQMKAIESSKNDGGILLGGLAKDKILGIREDFPPYVRNIIAQNAGFTIKSIIICRNPINNNIHNLLNMVSRGQISENMKKLQYDKLFHLFMIIKLYDNRMILVEKNEVVNMKIIKEDVPIDSYIEIKLVYPITFGNFIKNAVNKIGKSIYLFDHINNNCQKFVTDLLKSNNLLTPEADKFINQDIKSIFSTTPKWVNVISKLATDSYALLNRLIYGKGILID